MASQNWSLWLTSQAKFVSLRQFNAKWAILNCQTSLTLSQTIQNVQGIGIAPVIPVSTRPLFPSTHGFAWCRQLAPLLIGCPHKANIHTVCGWQVTYHILKLVSWKKWKRISSESFKLFESSSPFFKWTNSLTTLILRRLVWPARLARSRNQVLYGAMVSEAIS